MRHVLCTLLLLCAICLDTVVAQSRNQLVACYPFSGGATDGFGPNNGTVYGPTLVSDRLGNSNSAYFFDRTSYIDLPAGAFLNPTYTISAWVRPASLPSQSDAYTIFSFGDPNQTLTLANSPAYGGYVWNFFSYNSQPTIVTTQSVNANQWIHLTAVRASNQLVFYLNGEPIQTVTISPTTALTYTCPLKVIIGARPDKGSLIQFFHGTIDDIRFYRGVLSNAEVRAVYNATTCDTDFTLNPITAQPYRSLKNGNWSDSSVWSCNCVPTATDAVQVRHILTVPANYQANALRVYQDGAAKITYGIDGKLVFGQ